MLRDAGTRIYIYHEIGLDSSTSLSVGALLKSNERFDHTTADNRRASLTNEGLCLVHWDELSASLPDGNEINFKFLVIL